MRWFRSYLSVPRDDTLASESSSTEESGTSSGNARRMYQLSRGMEESRILSLRDVCPSLSEGDGRNKKKKRSMKKTIRLNYKMVEGSNMNKSNAEKFGECSKMIDKISEGKIGDISEDMHVFL